eukprot:1269472-Rhodomonas_salina.1
MYGAVRLRACYAPSSTDILYGAIGLCDVRYWPSTDLSTCSAACLRACYAVSSTDIACSATSLRPCYAMSGTGLAYGARRCAVLR